MSFWDRETTAPGESLGWDFSSLDWAPPRLVPALLVEGVAFSLPAARGAWMGYGVLSGLVALAALASGHRGAVQVRLALALLAALVIAHPVLSCLQLLVALAWAPLPRPQRPLAAFLAIFVGLATPKLEPFLGAPVRDQEGAFTLMTWNVAYLRQASWELRILHNFRSVRADMVVLQEIGWNEVRGDRPHWQEIRDRDREQTMRLAEALELPYHWSDAPMGYRRAPYQSGCVVLSRYPFEPLPDTLPRGPDEPPPAFVVDAPTGPLVVSPMHLWSPPYADLAQRRSGLRHLLQRLPGGFPKIVVGDSNLIPMDREDLPPAHSFQDTALVSPFFSGTWPAFFPVVRLDAVLVSPDLEVLRHRTLGTDASDHLPVMVQLRPRDYSPSKSSGPSS